MAINGPDADRHQTPPAQGRLDPILAPNPNNPMASARSFRRRIWRLAWRSLLAFVLLSEALVLPLRWLPPATSAVMLERWASARLRGDAHFRIHYRWVPWHAVSPWAPLAMVAGEDQTFPTTWGFDFGEIRDAIVAADHGARLRGASTITQQTAKNLFLWDGRSFVRKGIEAWFTVLLTLNLPKQRILTIYMNIAELGNGIFGVDAASRAYFHEAPASLSPREAALLAATLPNPHVYHAQYPSTYVLDRAAWIEQQMRQLGGPAYLPR